MKKIQKVIEQNYERELGEDMATKIEEKLVLYVDKVRFRAVSKLWSSIPPKMPDLRAKQLPWLLYQRRDDNGDASHALFNPLDKNNYLLDLREYKGKSFGGSSYGWVLTSHEHQDLSSYITLISSLINPLTKTRVELPPRDNYGDTYMWKIIWSSSPLSEDCVLVGIPAIYGLSCCRPKDDKWSSFLKNMVLDIIFHKGKLYALTDEKNVIVFDDINDPTKFMKFGSPVPLTSDHCYLVESSDEELIVVEKEVNEDHMSGFGVYKYDPINSRWFRVKSIGDQVIFVLDHISSGITVSRLDFPEFKRNHIYFSYEKHGERGVSVSFGVFSLEDETIKFGFQCGPMHVFLNDFHSSVWVTPSLI